MTQIGHPPLTSLHGGLTIAIVLLLVSVSCRSATDCGDVCGLLPAPPDPTLSADQRVVALAGGSASMCAVTEAGAVYCWGDNYSGALGDGTTTSRLSPVRVSSSQRFVAIAGAHGTSRNCAIDNTAAAYCWGYNALGEVGDGTHIDRYLPTPVGGGLTFSSLASSYHTCGLTTDGRAYCWGPNGGDALGSPGIPGDTALPVAV